MAMGGTVPYFIVLGNREMKSDWFKFRLRTFLKIEWMTHRLYKIEMTLSIQAISKEVHTIVHGCAARRVKTYGIPVKLRILPPDVRSENEPFRPDMRRLPSVVAKLPTESLFKFALSSWYGDTTKLICIHIVISTRRSVGILFDHAKSSDPPIGWVHYTQILYLLR